MKIVLNKAFGGFHLPDEYADRKGISVYNDDFEIRTDPELMEYITANLYKTDLRVIEFPDEATDFDIQEYDGLESLIYVVNCKIHYD